jgi:hypothetical protein
MKQLAAVMALAVFASGAASASDKADAMAVVHKWVGATALTVTPDVANRRAYARVNPSRRRA